MPFSKASVDNKGRLCIITEFDDHHEQQQQQQQLSFLKQQAAAIKSFNTLPLQLEQSTEIGAQTLQ